MSGTISGVFLPPITPFLDGAVDLASYERILERALARGVSGIVPLGTTGEASALEEHEAEMIVERTLVRKRSTTSAARIEPTTRCSSTLWMDALMNSDRSRTTRRS